ncbi:unnamed protein product [Symbiodinium sp. KB8]|nr:unnamed protein product [Symbiodinium sp. KB8]
MTPLRLRLHSALAIGDDDHGAMDSLSGPGCDRVSWSSMASGYEPAGAPDDAAGIDDGEAVSPCSALLYGRHVVEDMPLKVISRDVPALPPQLPHSVPILLEAFWLRGRAFLQLLPSLSGSYDPTGQAGGVDMVDGYAQYVGAGQSTGTSGTVSEPL